MIKILHFSDTHIDIISQGRRDPASGLPYRVMDFLKALDSIVDAALSEKVDLVLFAGDAFKDRNPVSTYRREWEQRIMRISQGGIPVLLLVGNHDNSPVAGRANTLHEFETLQVPRVKVLSQPCFLGPDELWGLQMQLIAIPYISRSSVMAAMEIQGEDAGKIYSTQEDRIRGLVTDWLEKKNPELPLVLAAHASIEGAIYGQERSVILGNDLVLQGSTVKDPRIDYVAMGHIHKAQDVNKDHYPPVVYPGSIERVDFGEAGDDKSYSMVHLEPGKTTYKLVKLHGRKFIDRSIKFEDGKDLPIATEFMQKIIEKLPSTGEMQDAMLRLVIRYPREWEALLDETALRKVAENAFEFHLIRQPFSEARLRLPADQSFGSLTPLDLSEMYWKNLKTTGKDKEELQKLAGEIFSEEQGIKPKDGEA